MRVGCGSIVLLMGTYNPEDAHLIKVSLQTVGTDRSLVVERGLLHSVHECVHAPLLYVIVFSTANHPHQLR